MDIIISKSTVEVRSRELKSFNIQKPGYITIFHVTDNYREMNQWLQMHGCEEFELGPYSTMWGGVSDELKNWFILKWS